MDAKAEPPLKRKKASRKKPKSTVIAMDAEVKPPKKKKKKTNHTSLSFSSLPDDIIVNCLARISRSDYRSLSLVSKSFYSFIYSPYLKAARSQIGNTDPCLYLCLKCSRNYHRWFTLDQTLITNGSKLTLVPRKRIPLKSPTPIWSAIVAVGSEIYQIGGSSKNNRSSSVRVLDCRNHTWRYAPNMSESRKPAKCFNLEGKIYVIGGCSSQSMNWGEVFDVKTQTWTPLARLKDGVYDTHLEVVAFAGKIYIITRDEKYGYDPKEGRWLQEEGFEGLERYITGRLCVIENVMFSEHEGHYRWYDSRRGEWLNVEGLKEDLNIKHGGSYWPLVQLVSYGEKLVIITRNKKICFAVIRLEKRIDVSGGLEIWGKIEQLKFLHIDSKSYKFLSCLSVSL